MKKRTLGQRLLGAPYIVWAAIFIIVPLLIVVYYSFTDADGNARHYAVSISGRDGSVVCTEYVPE